MTTTAELSRSATSEWFIPTQANIDDGAYYVVQTNGKEWRDVDLFVLKGPLVRVRLSAVRGKPARVARINA